MCKSHPRCILLGLNPDLPAISSVSYCESHALDHAASEAGHIITNCANMLRMKKSYWLSHVACIGVAPQCQEMVTSHLHYLPLAVFILTPLTFISTYTWSVLLDQVEPAFPYISDTGTLPPASCLFSQLLNIITVFMSCCVYIRYRLVKNAESGIIPWVNNMAAWLGGICCLGLSLVANFQESNVSSVHVLGADTCFIGGAIYFCLQVGFYVPQKGTEDQMLYYDTWFSHKMKPSLVSKKTLKFQICMSVLCFLCAVTTIVAGNIASAHFHDQCDVHKGVNTMKWLKHDGGWEAHLLSTAAEWMLTVVFVAFFLSYVQEFSRTTISVNLEIDKLEIFPNVNELWTFEGQVQVAKGQDVYSTGYSINTLQLFPNVNELWTFEGQVQVAKGQDVYSTGYSINTLQLSVLLGIRG
uniref:CWH43-like N-terminal domain-containing protein n=1 Tax=Timema poppense TaxID=170557 RepID=A0A7R9CGJ5_TIMPO|nr:unnamed protein product [Timema poppensis]